MRWKPNEQGVPVEREAKDQRPPLPRRADVQLIVCPGCQDVMHPAWYTNNHRFICGK